MGFKDTRVYQFGQRFKDLSRRRKIMAISLALFLVMITIPVITYAYYAYDISDPERLMNRNNTGIVILDRNGETLYSYGKTNHQKKVSLGEVSDSLEKAVVASEDKNFYKHPGYSPRGIAVALYANVLNQDLKRYGGSTITQQLVKNTLLTSNKSFLRKYQELSIAIAIDRHYSKDKILEMYLNSVYFGEGAFGIDQAAKTYFNKSANDLTLAESSVLVGLLPAPSTYSPISGDKAKAKEQQERVLTHMAADGYISQEEKDQALKQELAFEKGQENVQEHAQHYTLMVLEELKNRYGEELITRSGYRVTTGLDLNWQRQAEQLVKTRVSQLSRQGGNNAGLVAIDTKTGEIRAMVGSANWDDPEFGKVNMAVSARQPGSSFKPVYYAEAMDKKLITPATIMEDKPKTYGGNYKPENYDFRYRGKISIRKALALSLNIPAVDVMQKLGPEEASAAARRMGISTITEPEKYGLSLGLGTAEAKLLEMTNAYAAFANQGNQYSPVLISNIKNKFDKTTFSHKSKGKRVMSPEASFLISSILSDKESGAATFGSSLTVPGRPTAAKTGTTDKNRDAWTIGYTPSVAIGVWVGNNANQPMTGVAGSSGAAPIWKGAMQSFLKSKPAENFAQPPGVVKVRVCMSDGLRAERAHAGTYEEFFKKDGVPTGKCAGPVAEPPKEEKKEEKQEAKPEQKQEEKQEPEKKEEEGGDDNVEGGRGGGEPAPAPAPAPSPSPSPTPSPAPAPAPAPSPEPAPEEGD